MHQSTSRSPALSFSATQLQAGQLQKSKGNAIYTSTAASPFPSGNKAIRTGVWGQQERQPGCPLSCADPAAHRHVGNHGVPWEHPLRRWWLWRWRWWRRRGPAAAGRRRRCRGRPCPAVPSRAEPPRSARAPAEGMAA